jgi:hypothetical protein
VIRPSQSGSDDHFQRLLHNTSHNFARQSITVNLAATP